MKTLRLVKLPAWLPLYIEAALVLLRNADTYMQYSISVENPPYPVLCTLSADGCTAHVSDFPKITTQALTLEAALFEVKQQIEKALRQYKNPPIPTKQEQIVVPNNSVLVLVKAS